MLAALLVQASGLFASPALAQSHATQSRLLICPAASFPQTLPDSREDRKKALDELALFADVCLIRADYYAYRGALLVSLGRGAEAIEMLERSLLLSPHQPGVQFDYAQALAQGGERESASALLNALLERRDLHPDFRAFLERQKKELLRPHWRFGIQVSSLLGHETNLNSAPDARFFTFSSSAGDVVLELDPASQPKKGMGWLNSLAVTGMTELGGGQTIYVLGDLRSRQSGAGTDYLQAEGSLIWRGPKSDRLFEGGHQPNVRLGVSQLQFGGNTLFRGARGEAALETPLGLNFGDCRSRAGMAVEERRFPDATNNDGRYVGLIASAHCFYRDHMLSLQFNTGRDRPSGDWRAGGAQTRSELGLGWSRDYGRFWAQLIGAYSWAKDDEGYSPLIANGAVRRLDRYLARAELRVSVSRIWQWVVSLEDSRQASNIDLFDVKSRSLYSGVRASFE